MRKPPVHAVKYSQSLPHFVDLDQVPACFDLSSQYAWDTKGIKQIVARSAAQTNAQFTVGLTCTGNGRTVRTFREFTIASSKSIYGHEHGAVMVDGTSIQFVLWALEKISHCSRMVPKPTLHPPSPFCSSRSIPFSFQEDRHLFRNLSMSASTRLAKTICECSTEHGNIHRR